MLSDLEIGWLAGILEGEGCFLLDKRSPKVAVEMVDEDVINKVALIVERLTGKQFHINQRPPTGFGIQDRYHFQVSGESARIVMRAVVRHMCYRRRQRIWQVLNGYKQEKVDLVKLLKIGEPA